MAFVSSLPFVTPNAGSSTLVRVGIFGGFVLLKRDAIRESIRRRF
jgi:hypothetical protein